MTTRVKRATTPPPSRERPARNRGQVRELLILIGFLAVAAIGVVTVLWPETENQKDPDAQSAPTQPASATAKPKP